MLNKYLIGAFAGRSSIEFYKKLNIGDHLQVEGLHTDIIWMIETESRLSFVHGGVHFHSPIVNVDYFGYLTSTDLYNEFEETCKLLSLGTDSSLSVQVETIFRFAPYIEDSRTKMTNKSRGNGQYYGAPIPNEYKIPTFIDESCENAFLGSLTKLEIAKEVIICSRNTQEQNINLIKQTEEKWQDRNWIHNQLNDKLNELSLIYDKAAALIGIPERRMRA